MADDWQDLTLTTEKFTYAPNWLQFPQRDFIYNRELTNYPGTTTHTYNLWSGIADVVDYYFTNLTKEDEYNITDFFCRMRGRYGRFWLPIWKNQFELSSSIQQFDDTITIHNAYLKDVMTDYEFHIFIKLYNGDMISRLVTDVAPGASDTEIITVQSFFDRNINQNQIQYFGKLCIVRFDQDDLNLSFLCANSSETRIRFHDPLREYSLEYPGS